MKKRNYYWGIIFTILGLILLGNAFNMFSETPNFFTIVITVLLIASSLSNMPRLNFFGIIMPVIVAVIINRNILNLSDSLNSWWLILSGVFISIGLQSLIHKRPKRTNYSNYDTYSTKFTYSNDDDDEDVIIIDSDEVKEDFKKEYNKEHFKYKDRESYSETVDPDYVRINATFTDRTRYVRAENFTDGSIENDFGSLRVYFDQATFNPKGAHLYIDCNFGQVIIYLPRNINVINNISSTLGGVNDDFNRPNYDAPTLVLDGDVNFGNIKIIYL